MFEAFGPQPGEKATDRPQAKTDDSKSSTA